VNSSGVPSGVKLIVTEEKSVKIIVFFPPGNFSHDLGQKANKFQHSQLPDQITLTDGFVLEKHEKWC